MTAIASLWFPEMCKAKGQRSRRGKPLTCYHPNNQFISMLPNNTKNIPVKTSYSE